MERTGTAPQGLRELASEGARHFVALLVACCFVYLVLAGGLLFSGSLADALWGWGRTVVGLVVVTLVGHVLVTMVRGTVSLGVSAFFTWLALIVAMSAPMLGAGWDAVVTNFWFAVIVATPIILIATALRVFVPWFQMRSGGRPVRPRLDSAVG